MSEVIDDDYYPSIDIGVFCDLIEGTGRCEKLEIGTTVFYVIKGTGQTHRRTITLRTNGSKVVDFNLATSVAYRLKFFDLLTNWYKEHRKWVDGAYVE